ncbi:MAG: sugar kinase [Methanomassiliicoccales archaeon]
MDFRKDVDFDVCTMGEPLAEFSMVGRELFSRGCSGDAVNVAISISRLGLRAATVAAVGSDEHGAYIIKALGEEGIYTGGLTVDRDHPTGIYFITLGKEGEHTFTYYRKGSSASLMRLTRKQKEIAARSAAFHSSGITQAIGDAAARSLKEAVVTAHNAGVHISYDVNFRPALTTDKRATASMRSIKKFITIFMISAEDYYLLYGRKRRAEEILEELKDEYEAVIVKDGGRGAWGAEKGKKHFIRSFNIKAVDATGAGDAFDAGLLSALIQGMEFEGAMRFASANAAIKCLKKGGTRGLPTRRQLNAFLKKYDGPAERGPSGMG